MAEVTMPRLSDTMEEGTIATWLKKPGEQVNKGDVIAQVETDKATMDLTAFEAGTLQEILAPEGATVQIGKPVARIGSGPAPAASSATGAEKPKTDAAREQAAEGPAPTANPSGDDQRSSDRGEGTAARPSGDDQRSSDRGEGTAARPSGDDQRSSDRGEGIAARPSDDDQRSAKPSGDDQRSSDRTSAADTREETASRGAERPRGAAANGKVRASPMARHIAAEHGLDLADISGSGPQGRVIRADVEAALSAPAAKDAAQPPAAQAPAAQPEGDERVPLSQMRRTIARRMAESTRTVPHFYLTTTVDATDLAALRKQINEQTSDAGIKITVNDMIVKGAALAIRKVPEVNVSFAEDSLIRHSHVHVGIAVATERGLIVPVVRDVDQKSLGQIARETRDLAERANSGKLQPPDYSGGTFTVSNLGMFGIEQFNAVINPPESAILAVGAIVREPAEHDGQVALRERMRLTLSVDHRALDGAIGARYLQALKALLEKPMLLLV